MLNMRVSWHYDIFIFLCLCDDGAGKQGDVSVYGVQRIARRERCVDPRALVEVHPDPERAMSDGYQSLNFAQFEAMMVKCRRVAEAVGQVIR